LSRKFESNVSARKKICVAPFLDGFSVFADFPKAVKRLLRNDILMFRTASSVLHILPIAGLYTFLPKYLESQFRLAAHTANMISGELAVRGRRKQTDPTLSRLMQGWAASW